MDPKLDPDAVLALVTGHKWTALASFVIYAVIRLGKSDVVGPTIPPRVRIFVVFGLGIAYGVLERVAGGRSWRDASVEVVTAIFFAVVVYHETFIKSLRSGKELVVPGLMIEGARPSPTAPVTVPPPPPQVPE